MILTAAFVLFVVWAGGLAGSYAMGGFIHLLIVAAVVMVFVHLFQSRSLIPRKHT